MPGIWRLGGHLSGPVVSALVDGQLDEASAEHAWAHVVDCPPCRGLVEREGWVKTRLAGMTDPSGESPPAHLLGSLYRLEPDLDPTAAEQAWVAVGALEQRGRTRRRAGIALAGAGSVSVAVLGISALSGPTLGIGGAPVAPPSSQLTTPTSVPASSGRSPARFGTDPASRPSTWRSPFPAWVTPTRAAGQVDGAVDGDTRTVSVRPPWWDAASAGR